MKRSPLRAIGLRNKRRDPRRKALIERIHQRDEWCQFNRYWDAVAATDHLLGWAPDSQCWNILDVHEIIPSSVWPDGIYDDTNCVLVCRRHHSWIDQHPLLAHMIGLHGYSHERPT